MKKIKTISMKHNNKGKFSVRIKTFTERVRDVVKRIPKGKTLSYKEVAKKAGSPLAFRAVGSVMSKNHDKSVPCHRVIGSDGRMKGYNAGGIGVKRAILLRERAI